ncbi:nitrogen fixation protein NifQ [Magnetospirillum sulfuroxidans]|uniref:Nitrogen fixation protein NifQ n=1 Tax=Magnetospirillum sulfuroxidans TaxID=611300 RepID=A0ABS5IG87_9PROT|nr:nitrogen fixation protein NifQ [Magnetospirillum sulfuroxidans]MBR9973427.1 nitrogen fixation protein NifQ [Magnetospirillum sulfuroxidans]
MLVRADRVGFARLIAYARDPDNTDQRALACILSHRCNCPDTPYRQALGLDEAELRAVLAEYFPVLAADWPDGGCLRHRLGLACHHEAPPPGHGRFSASLLEQEEQDLCRLFLTHAADSGIWPVVFARSIARACMEPQHLWMSLGLEGRAQLSAILVRHFPALVARNDHDMRWKKFFYKLLCDEEKVWTCKASSCEICPHHSECYVTSPPGNAPAVVPPEG